MHELGSLTVLQQRKMKQNLCHFMFVVYVSKYLLHILSWPIKNLIIFNYDFIESLNYVNTYLSC